MKMIIVDDESATRNGLLKHISWLNLGIDQIKTIADAREALKICREWRPEIVLSDVRMPEMNGIELCRKLKEMNPNCEIIFISGYADKEALIAAIGLGAVSFVEKPIDLPALECAIEKAVQRYIEKDQHFSNHRILRENLPVIEMELVNSLIEDRITESVRGNAGIFGLSAGYQVLLFCSAKDFESRAALGSCVISSLPEIFDEYSYIKGFHGTREMLCILFGFKEDRFTANSELVCRVSTVLSRMKEDGVELFCAVGKPVNEMNQIRFSYENACHSRKELFFCGYGRMAYTQNTYHAESDRMCQELYQRCSLAIEAYDLEQAAAQVETMYQCFAERHHFAEEEIREYYFKLYGCLLRLDNEDEKRSMYQMEAVWRELRTMDTLKQLQDAFLKALHEKCDPVKVEGETGSIVREIMKIINQEYSDENLSVMQLARAVYLSPAYLSSIFKRETNMTIGQYITQVRINHARKYVKDRSLKLYQIAEKCGYNDPNYFAKIFRKNTGMTPSEYRGKRE